MLTPSFKSSNQNTLDFNRVQMPKYIVHVNVIRTRFIVRPSQNEKNDCIQHQTIALHFQFQAVFLKSLLKTQNYVS